MITLTTEEAIKELSRYTKDCYTPKNREAHRMAIEALEMKARLENKQETSDKASEENKRWISVFDMVPSGECIALGYQNEIIIGYVGDSGLSETGYAAENACEFLSDVTHWMPLPEPPRKDGA